MSDKNIGENTSTNEVVTAEQPRVDVKNVEKKEFFPRWFNNTIVDIQKIFTKLENIYEEEGTVLKIIWDKKIPNRISGYIVSTGKDTAGYYNYNHLMRKRLKVSSRIKNLDAPEMVVDKPSLAAFAKHFFEEEFHLLPRPWLYQICLTLASGGSITRKHIIKFPEWINLAPEHKNDYELIDNLYKLVSYRRRPGYKDCGGLSALKRFNDLAARD
jgi:hypothetical protein